MTKKQLIELWNSLDDDTEIEIPNAYYKGTGKIKKIIILTEINYEGTNYRAKSQTL